MAISLWRRALRAITRSPRSRRAPTTTGATTRPRPGRGALRPQYAPVLDGAADPGEIVWTWVPYEEDPSRGKDRPVLVVARDGPWVLGLPLSSKDHGPDGVSRTRHGQRWLDIGSGSWDSRGRPSEVRLDRVLRFEPTTIRREGAVLPRAVFDRVVREL